MLAVSGRSCVDFQQFWSPKLIPGAFFFGVFWKTVILSKSCSRCGGSTVSKGETLQKSVRSPTPKGSGARKRKKNGSGAILGLNVSLPSSFSRDFWVPARSKNRRKNKSGVFLGYTFPFLSAFFAQARSGRAPDRFWKLPGPSQTGIWDDFVV